jgi:hypothetical protein
MTRPYASWLTGEALALRFAVEEPVLLRYAKRGMLGAQWDEAEGRWLFDVQRVSRLFLRRGADSSSQAPHLGVLGVVCLPGGEKRKPLALPARNTARVGNEKTRCA